MYGLMSVNGRESMLGSGPNDVQGRLSAGQGEPELPIVMILDDNPRV